MKNEIELMMSIAQIGRRIRAKKRYKAFMRGKLHVPKPPIQIDRSLIRQEKKWYEVPVVHKSDFKWCVNGKHSVHVSNFNRHPRAPDGLAYKCKDCARVYSKLKMREKREKEKFSNYLVQ